MKRMVFFMVALMLLAFAACHKNSMSKIPKIALVSMTPDSVRAGNSFDTVFIIFHLQDGDADLGNDQSGTKYDIYMKDSRNDSVQGYFFPPIDQKIENPQYGIQGYCTFKLQGAFLIPRSDHILTGDTVHYDIYIKDRAQNESNHITTPDIYIKPH